jgi:hypothetical protein
MCAAAVCDQAGGPAMSFIPKGLMRLRFIADSDGFQRIPVKFDLWPVETPPKETYCNSLKNSDAHARLLDYLSLSRHGKSSSELGSVMILDPIVGNSLGKKSQSDRKHHNE